MSSYGLRRLSVRAGAVAAVLAGVVPGLGCAQPAAPPPQNAGSTAPAAAVMARPSPGPATPATPAGPPLRLVPSAEARPFLLASISIPSIDRTLSGATALLSRAVPLPLDAAGVKEMLLTQAGLPPKVGENLDTASPAGAVVIAVGGKEVAGLVVAVPAKGIEQARVVIGALGRVVSRRGEVVQVDNGSGGRGWVWQSANVIVLSDSVDALGRGAMLALDARRSSAGEDVTAVLYPEPIARANGTDLKTALSVLVSMARSARAAQIQEARAGKGTKPSGKDGAKAGAKPVAKPGTKAGASAAPDPAAKGAPAPADAPADATDHSLDMLEDLAGYAGDTGNLEIGLSMDDGRGLVASLRVHPLPGTPFEALTAEGHPFAIDPALLRHPDDVAFVLASSYGPFFRAQVARQRKRLAESHEKGAAAALDFYDVSVAALEGSWSGVAELQPNLSVQLSYPLKDDAAAAKLGAAMARLDPAAAKAIWQSQLGLDQQRMFDWKLKKETVGKIKVLHYLVSFDSKAFPPTSRDTMKKLLGGPAFDIYVGVVGTRMLITGGRDGKAKLIELGRDDKAAAKADKTAGTASAAGDKPDARASRVIVGGNGDLADALAAVKGKDSFGYIDLGPLLGVIASLADDPRARAIAAGASAPIPTFTTFGTDGQAKLLTFTWTITPSAFAGAGAILQGLGGGVIK